MLQVLTQKEKVTQKTTFFRLKPQPPAEISYLDQLVDEVRLTCRFDWMLVEDVEIGGRLIDYALVGPKGLVLVDVRQLKQVHLTNTEYRVMTKHGWKRSTSHPGEELKAVCRLMREMLKKNYDLAIPVFPVLVYPKATDLRKERLKLAVGTDFSIVKEVIEQRKGSPLVEKQIKQVAYTLLSLQKKTT